MRCSDFLNLYSDYVDRMLTAPVERKVRQHLDVCRRCARYERVMRRGTELLRHSSVEPSVRSRVQLRCRLALSRRARRRPAVTWPASVAATLLVAAVVVEGVTQSSRKIRRPHTPPPQPIPTVVANPGPPFVTLTDFSMPVFGSGEHSLPAVDSIGQTDSAVATSVVFTARTFGPGR